MIKAFLLMLASVFLLCSCTASGEKNMESFYEVTVSLSADDIIFVSDMFTQRDLDYTYSDRNPINITLKDNASECTSSNVDIEGNTITVKGEGVFVLSGSLSDGQIIVDAGDSAKIQLVLDSVNINCDTSAAIYCKSAKKLFVTTISDSTLSNKNDFIAIDENDIDAVIYSKSDLTLNGSKKLSINALYGNCVVSNDDLAITSGEYDFTSAKHTIKANNSIRVADSVLNLNAKKDGMHSKNDDIVKGFVYIESGDITINADDEGIQSSSAVKIEGGNLTIQQSGEGIEGRFVDISGGNLVINASDDGINAVDKESSDNSTETASEAQMPSNVPNGTNTQPPGNMPNGTNTQPPGDMPNGTNTQPPDDIPNGTNTQPPGNMPNGTDAKPPDDMPNGTDAQPPDDMPDRADGGNQPNDIPSMVNGKGAMSGTSTDCSIIISGGNIIINADGDGLDSNGIINISGGESVIYGAENNGDSAVDYETQLKITGGKIIALGMSEMAENVSAVSSQCSILYNTSALGSADDVVQLLDGNEVIAQASAVKKFNSILISCPELSEKGKYTIKIGAAEEKIKMNGTSYSNSHKNGFGMNGSKNKMKNIFSDNNR